jgi:hypothetical protein
MGEISMNCYFVERGKVGVYVQMGELQVNNNYNTNGTKENTEKKNLALFCTLDEGSYFNLSHCLLEKESLFIFKAETNVHLLLL